MFVARSVGRAGYRGVVAYNQAASFSVSSANFAGSRSSSGSDAGDYAKEAAEHAKAGIKDLKVLRLCEDALKFSRSYTRLPSGRVCAFSRLIG